MARLLVILQVLLLIEFSVSWTSPRGRNSCPNDAKEPWTYSGPNGPPYWGETYPQCYGEMQSPVALDFYSATRADDLERLQMVNYDQPITKAKIENNGHTVQITPEDGQARTISVEGDTYTLQQLHFHWGSSFFQGSEHTINRLRTAMEMHLVHMNSNNQIAVVGVFLQTYRPPNSALQVIVDSLPEVQFKGDSTQLSSPLNLSGLIPSNPARFYRYDGSLTTPDCSEAVKWSVLTNVVDMGETQIAAFRKLNSADDSEENANCKLVDNFRPLQPLNGRTIFLSK